MLCPRCGLGEVTHLENAHAKCVAQDLVGLKQGSSSDVGGSYEEFKGVILLYVQPRLYFFLQLSAFFSSDDCNHPTPPPIPREPVNWRG